MDDRQPAQLQYECVSLIGYRCTGKTTVGQLLAERLAWQFCDSDQVIATRTGKSIADIFREDGVGAFRDLEQQVVDELAGGTQKVLSVGGGAVLRKATAARLRGVGPVIWLKAGQPTILARLGADRQTATQRPALTERDVREEVAQVLAEREAIYGEYADYEVATDSLTPSQVADEIFRWLANRG